MALTLVLLLLPAPQISLPPMGGVLSASAPPDAAFRDMYNLQFDDAHRTIQQWESAAPSDPLGPTADAAAYLFDEFHRLGVLQSELFVDDSEFKHRKKPPPDPALKARFEAALTASDRLADAELQTSPNDRDALLAKTLDLGLRADYLALVEKRDLASLGYVKSAGVMAQRLLAEHPDCYDAYLAVGAENYILGLSSAPVRWMLRLYGAETDKEKGIKSLELTATHGHYLLPYARLLLAVAALRDKDRSKARRILQELADQFPENPLYGQELARLQ